MKKVKVLFLAMLVFACVCFASGCGEKVYKINFMVDGQVYHIVQSPGKDIVELPSNPTKDNFVFLGWYEDENTWTIPFDSSSLSNKSLNTDIMIYAKWGAMANDYHIHITDFQAVDNENYFISVSNSSLTFNFNKYITVSNFFTWELSTDIMGLNKIPSKAVNLNTGNNVFYAIFTNNSGDITPYTLTVRRRPIYSVVFNTNGGSPIEAQFVEEGLTMVPVNQPTKTGYVFDGWDKDASQAITGNVTFNAKWRPEDYSIIYHLDGGVNNSENPAYYNVESGTTTLKAPTKAHYIFDGWYDDSDLSYQITTIYSGSRGDINLYAKWVPYNYSITYYTNGGTNDQSNVTSYNIESDKIILKEPTRTSYKFKGWYKDSGYKEEISVIETGSYGDLKLYARWQAGSYNIIYHLDGGTNNADNP
ncbi:MAG: InlB B-repeat-containing protein, partial [Clostridia bacterium]|nr:InlB B-repeat-containing protein [Clostridia bacterium]